MPSFSHGDEDRFAVGLGEGAEAAAFISAGLLGSTPVMAANSAAIHFEANLRIAAQAATVAVGDDEKIPDFRRRLRARRRERAGNRRRFRQHPPGRGE